MSPKQELSTLRELVLHYWKGLITYIALNHTPQQPGCDLRCEDEDDCVEFDLARKVIRETLPAGIRQEILNLIRKEDLLKVPYGYLRAFRLLYGPDIQQAVIERKDVKGVSYWPFMNTVWSEIQEHGTCLQFLKFHTEYELQYQLYRLFQHLENLQYLDFESDCEGDDVLRLVAKNCPQIKSIIISQDCPVSSKGIHSLCYENDASTQRRPLCSTLQVLSIDWCLSKEEDIAMLLRNCKVLHSLPLNDRVVGALQILEREGCFDTQVKLVSVFDLNSSARNIDLLQRTCPNLRQLTIALPRLDSLSTISTLPVLTELVFFCFSTTDSKKKIIEDLFSKSKVSNSSNAERESNGLGERLTTFKVEWTDVLDVTDVAKHCTALEEADFGSVRITCERPIIWEALRTIDLSKAAFHSPIDFINMFAKCPSLESLCLPRRFLLTLFMFRNWYTSNKLENLQILKFSCETANAGELLETMLTDCPKLSHVEVCKSSWSTLEREILRTFTINHMYKVEVLFLEDPTLEQMDPNFLNFFAAAVVLNPPVAVHHNAGNPHAPPPYAAPEDDDGSDNYDDDNNENNDEANNNNNDGNNDNVNEDGNDNNEDGAQNDDASDNNSDDVAYEDV